MKSKYGLLLQSAWLKRLSLASGTATGVAASPWRRWKVDPQREMKAWLSLVWASRLRAGSDIQVSAMVPSVRTMSPTSSDPPGLGSASGSRGLR
ncbi:hypothetical protein MPOCJGCO_3326 [Methylobacterium trifolii]|uniref:Secreted protein n=1 Tax=Methylobacterium trifolii TaxID=1003092 RepID=A0ABQ4U5U8_9HYPH|nr:hypothetical protein MPOCJGCO_3326 [Methylobacterium trifolii]